MVEVSTVFSGTGILKAISDYMAENGVQSIDGKPIQFSRLSPGNYKIGQPEDPINGTVAYNPSQGDISGFVDVQLTAGDEHINLDSKIKAELERLAKGMGATVQPVAQ